MYWTCIQATVLVGHVWVGSVLRCVVVVVRECSGMYGCGGGDGGKVLSRGGGFVLTAPTGRSKLASGIYVAFGLAGCG